MGQGKSSPFRRLESLPPLEADALQKHQYKSNLPVIIVIAVIVIVVIVIVIVIVVIISVRFSVTLL